MVSETTREFLLSPDDADMVSEATREFLLSPDDAYMVGEIHVK